MKAKHVLVAIPVLVLLTILVTSCGEYYDLPEDCLPDEVYDYEDELCYPAEDDWVDEDWQDEEWEDWYYELPEDCFPGEVYDYDEKLCYVEVDCETDEECFGFEDDLIDGFFTLVDELAQFFDAGADDFYVAEEQVLVTYEIQGNAIVNPVLEAVTGDLEDMQADSAAHQEMWAYFASLIPQEDRAHLTKFVIFTDGVDETMAAVEQDQDDPTRWVLAIDPADAGDPEELTYTFVHEYGHLLTLNTTQVELDPQLFYQPDNDALYEQAASVCPQYFPGEGCSLPSSYIDAFYDQFWSDIYDEWDETNYVEDDDEYYELLDDFYYRYQDRFVSDYAATNPGEDIAESWTYFVLQPLPEGSTIADQKILFFNQYPELVRLRAEIISRTYSRLRRR